MYPGLSYTKVNGWHCINDAYGSYATIEEAQNACTRDNNCKGIYDNGCDDGAGFEEGFGISLCPIKAPYSTYMNLENSCIYRKVQGPGEKLFHDFT